jgi:hypothetical protein
MISDTSDVYGVNLNSVILDLYSTNNDYLRVPTHKIPFFKYAFMNKLRLLLN